MTLSIVITTINEPTPGVERICAVARTAGVQVIVVGDNKTPSDWACPGATFVPMGVQSDSGFRVARQVPQNSYARKMIGYLLAAQSGAGWIRETDDDNEPYDSFFDGVPEFVVARQPVEETPWINIYRYFTDRFIWPRGFPLGRIQSSFAQDSPPDDSASPVRGLFVYQALADGDPDVDAVYRLSAPDVSDVLFRQAPPLQIPSSHWTPFNSQATTWPRALLPLMYLPTTCSFRMTDIWRSFVAQRLMRGLGAHVVITAPTVFQKRNQHDLMSDFGDEIEGYIGYERLTAALDGTPILGGPENVLKDLRALYEALSGAELLRHQELDVLDAWIADMSDLGFGGVQ